MNNRSPHLEPFLQAVHNGDTETVRRLMMVIDPSWNNNEPLRIASALNDTNMIMTLLMDPRVDPKVNNFEIYKNGIRFDNEEILHIILQDYRVDDLELTEEDVLDPQTLSDADYCDCENGCEDCEDESHDDSMSYCCECDKGMDCDCEYLPSE